LLCIENEASASPNFLASTPLPAGPCDHGLVGLERHTLLVDRDEHGGIELGQVAGGFEREIDPRKTRPFGTVEADRHAAEADILGQSWRPIG
jgi:hypothetical protein